MIKEIERDQRGFITVECFGHMQKNLPIKVYINDEKRPHRTIRDREELDRYFRPALPYLLTTRYEYQETQ